ncbi:MAG: hypothetical protein J0653_03890 [Deltaproteobacteria bacterium]|nr:hypothetical protein [Deltaproteobacteria bacterium]
MKKIKLPTMILTEPAYRDDDAATRVRGDKWFLCDDGSWYTMRTMADHLARIMANAPTYQGLISRIYRWGWESKVLFEPMNDRRLPMNPNRRRDETGPALEWLMMGSSPRESRVSSIKQLGRWERAQLTKEGDRR